MDKQHDHFSVAIQAIGLGLLSWTLFALGDVAMKWLARDYHLAVIQISYSICGLIMTFIYAAFCYRGRNIIRTPQWKLHLVRGALVGGTAVCVINGVSRLPLAEFYCIIFLTPLVTCLFSVVFLRERMTLHHIISAVLGFIGVIIVAGPEISNMNSGVLFLLGAVLFISFNAIIIRKIDNSEPTATYQLYAFSFIFLINALILVWQSLAPSIQEELRPVLEIKPSFALILVLSVFFFSAVIFNIRAFSKAPSTAIVAPFQYCQLLFGVILGYVFFQDIPPASTWSGGALIVVAGLYLVYQEHQGSKRRAVPIMEQ